MSDKIVKLGRAQNDPDERVINVLEYYLELAKEGRLRNVAISAEVRHPDDWELDEIQSRWIQAHEKNIDLLRMLGLVENLKTAIAMRLHNLGWDPGTDDEEGED